MEIVIWLIVGLAVGGAIGALATWYISRARGGAVSVMQLKKENDQFRNEVTEHFVETARLINQMTDSYKQVFDHLSSGAEKLVDNDSLAERLPPASGQEVKLSQFGAPASSQTRGSESELGGGADDRPSGTDTLKVPGASRDPASSAEKPDPLKSRAGQAGSESGRSTSSSKASGAGSTAKSDSKQGEKADNDPAGSKDKRTSMSSQSGGKSDDDSDNKSRASD